MIFKECLNKVLKYEGTYSNNPKDSGAETYKGISRHYHPNWDGWQLIDKIKEKDNGIESLKDGDIHELNPLVALFYKKEFWEKIEGDKLSKINDLLVCEVFDMAVNMGIKTAIKNLQNTINIVFDNYINKKIKVDGIFGKKTLGALFIMGNYNILMELTDYFQKYRALKYAKIVKKNPKNVIFLEGWIKRALKID